MRRGLVGVLPERGLEGVDSPARSALVADMKQTEAHGLDARLLTDRITPTSSSGRTTR
jgi:hypothetical protein